MHQTWFFVARLTMVNRRLLRFWIPLVLLGTLGLRHPIHLTLTELRWNASTRTLEITHKLFLDDLEAALIKGGAPKPLRLGVAGEHPQADSLLVRYLNLTRRLSLDGQRVQPRYVGREADLEAMFVYEEVVLPTAPAQISLQFNALMELYDDQRAIVNVFGWGERTRSAILHPRQQSVSWNR